MASAELRSFCISHAKDVDGIVCAALLVAARGAGFGLTDYDDLIDSLEAVPSVDEFVLCDLGTDPTKFPKFAAMIGAIAKRAKVTYIDHHFMTPGAKRELRTLGVRVVHDSRECAGMLTYRTFKNQIPDAGKLLALYAAVTDYLDNSPMSNRMMQRFDRHYVLLEATLLSYAVARKGGDAAYRRMLVNELSKMKLPHEIDEVVTHALEQAGQVRALSEQVGKSGTVRGRVAYAETTEHATGNIAKLLLGTFDVPVALAFREKERKGWVEVSLRGTSECPVHLGRAISALASKFGGDGGGHRLAAGCSIPRKNIQALIAELDAVVSSTSSMPEA